MRLVPCKRHQETQTLGLNVCLAVALSPLHMASPHARRFAGLLSPKHDRQFKICGPYLGRLGVSRRPADIPPAGRRIKKNSLHMGRFG